MSCPPGWWKETPGRYLKRWGEHTLQTRQSDNWRTRRWTVERIVWNDATLEALVLGLGYAPIWGQTRREAMFLTQFYCSGNTIQLIGACWKPTLN
jgi:hypothetical protein